MHAHGSCWVAGIVALVAEKRPSSMYFFESTLRKFIRNEGVTILVCHMRGRANLSARRSNGSLGTERHGRFPGAFTGG